MGALCWGLFDSVTFLSPAHSSSYFVLQLFSSRRGFHRESPNMLQYSNIAWPRMSISSNIYIIISTHGFFSEISESGDDVSTPMRYLVFFALYIGENYLADH
ncbi:hypothetical protein CYLTODRAFT_273158 [Cylindrobasidium torrendii FP15055 ss-10]|uniref:Uncharacterized protein n=1 Tax=Cylindrobasidium torrendii FP15055 ss-10 TaxID=1314674 RepID=A0A0D7BC18_9AGAR|nr:hypothetical protein CYLTODRAFT_273158 [Cylindrobasidium torrendii FP15055 ss-10]